MNCYELLKMDPKERVCTESRSAIMIPRCFPVLAVFSYFPSILPIRSFAYCWFSMVTVLLSFLLITSQSDLADLHFAWLTKGYPVLLLLYRFVLVLCIFLQHFNIFFYFKDQHLKYILWKLSKEFVQHDLKSKRFSLSAANRFSFKCFYWKNSLEMDPAWRWNHISKKLKSFIYNTVCTCCAKVKSLPSFPILGYTLMPISANNIGTPIFASPFQSVVQVNAEVFRPLNQVHLFFHDASSVWHNPISSEI